VAFRFLWISEELNTVERGAMYNKIRGPQFYSQIIDLGKFGIDKEVIILIII
jgi:hypothetical protein